MRKSVVDFLGAAAVRVLRFWPLLSGRLASIACEGGELA